MVGLMEGTMNHRTIATLQPAREILYKFLVLILVITPAQPRLFGRSN